MPKTGDQIDTAIKPLFERHNEALKVLGTGNGAGTLASVAALHTFSDQAVILPIVKIAAGFFAGGVILFAIAYLAFTTAHIFIQDYTVKLDRYGTSPVTMKAHDAAMGGLYVAAATAYLSAACFFIGIGAGFIALIRTSSARASRIGGTSRPSAFAVLRLTDGNIFVGNSIGKSIRPSKTFRRKDMKRCALCHGKLGLSARFRNIWNGRWWVHVRFCSVRCEVIYEVTRNDAAKHRWHAFLARGNSRT